MQWHANVAALHPSGVQLLESIDQGRFRQFVGLHRGLSLVDLAQVPF
jgi:hypothetical protein